MVEDLWKVKMTSKIAKVSKTSKRKFKTKKQALAYGRKGVNMAVKKEPAHLRSFVKAAIKIKAVKAR